MRKTKIICTIGPASDSPEIQQAMLDAGMNVARLNFSHGKQDEHRQRISSLRRLERINKQPLSIMLDTAGPEIRTGPLAAEFASLKAGQEFTLTSRSLIGNDSIISISYDRLAEDVTVGDSILIDDGLIQLEVTSIEGRDIHCRVMNGGRLKSRKSVNVPGVRLGLPFLSDRDRADILFGIEQNVDFIAASFVRCADDILEICKILEDHQSGIQIIAKIESQHGVCNLDDIIKVADGVMVARGDLGVEIAPEEVPLLQRKIINNCRDAGKFVIIATQMLDSMITNPRPTRAEVSDVANAVLDGADAIMLSGESAAGAYPVESVLTMARIASRTEKEFEFNRSLAEKALETNLSVTDAVAFATCSTAMHLGIDSIITATRTGRTARRVARYRPRANILAVTPDFRVLHKMALVWGVYPLLIDEAHGTDELMDKSLQACLEAGLISPGDLTIFAAGNPTGFAGDTNFMKVHLVSDILIQGMGIGNAIISGPARIISDEAGLQELEDGDILVTHSASSHYVPFLGNIKAIVAEEGGLTSDSAIIGLSMGIPVVVGAVSASKLLASGEIITVDCGSGRIYRGQIQHSR